MRLFLGDVDGHGKVQNLGYVHLYGKKSGTLS